MKYALLINDVPEPFANRSEADVNEILQEYAEVAQDPAVYGGQRLKSFSTATTVRVQDGDLLLTDGPYTEAKEYLGGFYLVDVPDLDAAIALARRIPAAREGGSIEIRPIIERTN